MSKPERMHFELASPEQAQELSQEVDRLATLYDSSAKYGMQSERKNAHATVSEVPREVLVHVPEPNPGSEPMRYSVRVAKEDDHDLTTHTSIPRTEGIIASVGFYCAEPATDELIYGTNVNYNVSRAIQAEGAQYSVERYISSGKYGIAAVRQEREWKREEERDPERAWERGAEQVADLLRAHREADALKAFGLNAVGKEEAQAVIDFLKSDTFLSSIGR